MKMSVNSSSVHWIYSVESYSLFTFLTLSAGHDAEVIRGGLPVGRMAEVVYGGLLLLAVVHREYSLLVS